MLDNIRQSSAVGLEALLKRRRNHEPRKLRTSLEFPDMMSIIKLLRSQIKCKTVVGSHIAQEKVHSKKIGLARKGKGWGWPEIEVSAQEAHVTARARVADLNARDYQKYKRLALPVPMTSKSAFVQR